MFNLAGDIPATNVAMVDPITGAWSSLGTIDLASVGRLVVSANGDLVVSGSIASVSALRRWNGTAWLNIPAPAGANQCTILLALPNGDLLGSTFGHGPSGYFANVVRWDGASWSTVGGEFTHPTGIPAVAALAVLPNGELVAGGEFVAVAGQSSPGVARWNGSAWSTMGAGLSRPTSGSGVESLAVLPNGTLVAGGQFVRSGTQPIAGIAAWSGTNWAPMDTGSIGYARDFGILPSGELLAASDTGLQVWNGSTWSSVVTTAAGGVRQVVPLPSGSAVVAGGFSSIGTVNATSVALWDGSAWHALGPDLGPNGSIACHATLPNGEVVCGGQFTRIGAIDANRIVRWDGTAWTAFGSGADATVRSLTVMPNGSLVAAGDFSSIDGVAANRIAIWDGSQWSALGGGTNGAVFATLAASNGDLFVGGGFTTAGGLSANRIAKWNGAAWSSLGVGIEPSLPVPVGFLVSVNAIAELPDNRIVVGGAFTVAGSSPARCLAAWDGSGWSPLATSLTTDSGTPLVAALAVLPNGHLVVGGRFDAINSTPASAIAKWNGSAWSSMGSGMQWPIHIEARAVVVRLVALPDGDVVAGGQFTVPSSYVARWHGSAWSGLGSGTTDVVTSVHFLANGTLLVGGNFLFAGGLPSNRLARYQASCPAGASVFGPGCAASGGLQTLEVTSPAWIDSTFRATATGLPTTAFVLALSSFTPIVPGLQLGSILAQAGSGCDLHVEPEIVQTLFTTSGSATSSHFLVNSPPLLGMTFYHQMISVEVDAMGAITSIGATNALQLTAGVF